MKLLGVEERTAAERGAPRFGRRLLNAVPDIVLASAFAQRLTELHPSAAGFDDPLVVLLMVEFLLLHSTIFLAPLLALVSDDPRRLSRAGLWVWVLVVGGVYALLAAGVGSAAQFWLLCARRMLLLVDARRAAARRGDPSGLAAFGRLWRTEFLCFAASILLAIFLGRNDGEIPIDVGLIYFSATAALTASGLRLRSRGDKLVGLPVSH